MAPSAADAQLRSIISTEATSDSARYCCREPISTQDGQPSAAQGVFIDVPPGIYRYEEVHSGHGGPTSTAVLTDQSLPEPAQPAADAPATQAPSGSSKQVSETSDIPDVIRQREPEAVPLAGYDTDQQLKPSFLPNNSAIKTRSCSARALLPNQGPDTTTSAAAPPADDAATQYDLPKASPLKCVTNTAAWSDWQLQLHQFRQKHLIEPPEALPSPSWPAAINLQSLTSTQLNIGQLAQHQPCPPAQRPQPAADSSKPVSHASQLQIRSPDEARQPANSPFTFETISDAGIHASATVPSDPSTTSTTTTRDNRQATPASAAAGQAGGCIKGRPTPAAKLPLASDRGHPAGGQGGNGDTHARPSLLHPAQNLPEAFERSTQHAIEATLAVLATSMRRRCQSIDRSPAVGSTWCAISGWSVPSVDCLQLHFSGTPG